MRIKLKNVVLSYYITGRYYHRHFRLSYNVVIYKKKNASKTVHVMSYELWFQLQNVDVLSIGSL